MIKLVISLVSIFLFAASYFYFVPTSSSVSFIQYLPNSITSLFKENEVVELLEDESDMVFIDEAASRAMQATQKHKKPVVEENVEVSSDLLSEVLVNIKEQGANGISSNDPTNTKIQSPKSTDIVKLEHDIVEMNTSINDLDNENEKLQQKFKEMLKKNKDLAATLGHIEEKLKTSN